MLADRSESDRDFPDSEHENTGTVLRDPEIAQIAVFKLRECAARLETLAGTAHESPLREHLRDIARQLRGMDAALLRQVR